MLSSDRVVLRAIERSDLPRLWELLEDLEVAVMAELGPVKPTSLAEYIRGFVEEGRLRQHSWVRGEFQDELVMSVLREDWKPRT